VRRYRVELAPGAVEDLAAIQMWLRREAGDGVAERFLARLLDHIAGYEVAPKRGRLREDLRPGLRLAGWRRVVTLAFRVDDEPAVVVILAALYRGRDVERTLRGRD